MRNSEAHNLELEERIEQVGKYFLETAKSTREIAKYFSDNFFSISNKTVSVYIQRFKKDNPQYKEKINKLIEENTEKDFKSDDIKKQILIELDLLFKGYTTDQIAEIFDKGQSSVQRDLTIRLKKLCEEDPSYLEIYTKALEKLASNQQMTTFKSRKH